MNELQRDLLYETIFNRRDFLRGAAAVTLPLLRAPGLLINAMSSPTDVSSFPGLIVREKEPENLEFPFVSLDRFILGNERFYIRNHFPIPKLDVASSIPVSRSICEALKKAAYVSGRPRFL